MVDTDNQQGAIIEELIRNVFEKFSKKERMGISKKQVLKILYNVKMDLPKDNKIKEILAFYWYKNGPYSEPIINAITNLITKKLVHRINKPNMEIYNYSHDVINTRLIPHNDHLSQTVLLIIHKVDEFRNVNDMIHSTYTNNAPYVLYTSYKNEFLNKFENFCTHLFENHDITSMRFGSPDIEDCFAQVIIDMPQDRCFRQLAFSLNLYSQGLHAIFSHNPPYNQTILDLLKQAFDLCDMIWDAFACGVRIQHHDAYYDDDIPKWQNIYNNKLTALRQKVDSFHVDVFEKIKDQTKLPKDIDYPNEPQDTAFGYSPAKARKLIEGLTK